MADYQSRMTRTQQVSSSKPQLFQSLAQRLHAFSSKQQDILDMQMAKKAKQQGLTDAQGKTAITLRTGETIADDAWNEGAIASHAAAVKLSMTENIGRIALENTRNPEGFEEQAKGYATGMLEGVPEIMRPALQDEISTTLLKVKTQISSDLTSFNRQQHLAKTSTAIDLYRTEGQNHAKVGDVESATESQYKALSLTNSLETSGLLTAESAEKQRRDITRDIEDQVIYGAFSRDMQAGNGARYISRFKQLKTLGDRNPEYRQKMVDTMLGMIEDTHSADDALRKQEETERKERYRLGERQLVTADIEGNITKDMLETMLREDTIDPKIAAKYKKNAMSEAPEFSDGTMKNAISADVLAFTEFELLTHPDLSMDDRQHFVSEHRRLSDDAANWRRTQNGSEGARRINQAFGIIKGVDTRISKEKAQRAGVVLTRYFNEVETLPLEQREMKSVEIADKLVKEVNGEIAVSDLQNARQRLADAPYQTEAQIKEADLGSEEEKIQIKQLQRKLKRIEKLERESGQ